jgi:hypothetical protein
MVGVYRVRGDNDKDTRDEEEVVDYCPPGKPGEQVMGLDVGEDASEE